jgi:hypothetical protein
MLSKNNELRRKRYAEDPEYRAHTQACKRAWHHANKEEVNAERRRRYAANPPDHRKSLYGVSDAEYRAMVKRQKGRCAICRKKPTDHSLYIDHCHRCGKVGRLLCRGCNFGLGHYKDNPRFTRAATTYLETFRCECCCPAVPPPRKRGGGKASRSSRRAVILPTTPTRESCPCRKVKPPGSSSNGVKRMSR